MKTTDLYNPAPIRQPVMELRTDAREILDAFFEQFGSCILRGCEVGGSSVSPGLVALAGIENGSRIFRVVRFAGAESVHCFPVYLTLRKTAPAQSGIASPVFRYEAVLVPLPPDVPHIRIEKEGGRTFLDALRDEMAHFFPEMEYSANMPTFGDRSVLLKTEYR